VSELDGELVIVRNLDRTRRYRCSLIHDLDGDDFDCSADVMAGSDGVVSSLGIATECTGGAFGNIGVCFDGSCDGQNCTYACTFDWD
jgi:hypothetical protein